MRKKVGCRLVMWKEVVRKKGVVRKKVGCRLVMWKEIVRKKGVVRKEVVRKGVASRRLCTTSW